jgi:hypothetical protein
LRFPPFLAYIALFILIIFLTDPPRGNFNGIYKTFYFTYTKFITQQYVLNGLRIKLSNIYFRAER